MAKTRDEIARKEATKDPIFLFQVREIVVINNDFTYSSDAETFIDCYGGEYTEEKLLEMGEAVEKWRTESVWLYRDEAVSWGKNHDYRFSNGWRVYCVPAYGELAEQLKKE